MLDLAWPYAFLLLPLPYLLRLLFKARPNLAQAEALNVPFYSILSDVRIRSATTSTTKPRYYSLLSLVWLLLVMALARPEWLGPSISLPVSGRDLLLAVDVSGSMETPDLTRNSHASDRLSVVKALAHDFLQRREGDRIGLILFGSGAYLQSPLSYDVNATSALLSEAEIGIAGERTAIGDAIGLAVKQLQQSKASNRVLVLLTDGSNNAGNLIPKKATVMAKKFGITIYTIGVGAHSMTINSLLGRHTINPSQDLDESLLRDIAAETGGKYFRAANSKGLEAIYHEIDQLQPVPSNPEKFRPITPLYQWPLMFSLFILWSMVFLEYRNSVVQEEKHV